MRILRTTERYEAGWREQNFIPDDEAHWQKSIDFTLFINLAWLIWHHIDTKLAEKALQK